MEEGYSYSKRNQSRLRKGRNQKNMSSVKNPEERLISKTKVQGNQFEMKK